jgi:predicted nucleic acid-binding protein
MQILITDACIFIDILGLEISSNFFLLNAEIHTTYEVWDEVNEEGQEILKAYREEKKLTIHILEPNEHQEITNRNYPRALSPPDQSVLFIAERLDAILLSSDGAVRKHAKKIELETHGLFWVIDELVDQEHLSKSEACKKLKQLFERNLMYKNNSKLLKEAEMRLKNWS